MPSFGKELLDMARGVADFGGVSFLGSACSERLVAFALEPDFDERPNKGLTCVEPGWPR
jgi:hypothetical protein